MKRICTGILLFGISTTSPLHAFDFTPGSNWGGPTMNWGNTPAWNNGPNMNWGNVPGWNSPMMNRGNPAPWNTNMNNWGNIQSWSPFNFGNNGWPTFTMPNINWQNQNMPGWNNYPPTAGNYMNNRVPAVIYQPVIPLKLVPAPVTTNVTGAAIPPLPSPVQMRVPQQTMSAQPVIPSVALPQTISEPPAIEKTVTPEPQAAVEMVKTADTKQQEVVTNSASQDGPIFPDPENMPPELKEIEE